MERDGGLESFMEAFMERLAPIVRAAFAFGLSRDDVLDVIMGAPAVPDAFEWIPAELARLILLRDETAS